jgi:hypothetical protein
VGGIEPGSSSGISRAFHRYEAMIGTPEIARSRLRKVRFRNAAPKRANGADDIPAVIAALSNF